MDVVRVMAGRPVEPATIKGVPWVLQTGEERIHAERIGPSVGEQAGEDLVDEASAGGDQRRGGQGEGPVAEVGAPLGPASIQLEVLAKPAVGVAGGAKSAKAPTSAFLHVQRVQSEDEHLFR